MSMGGIVAGIVFLLIGAALIYFSTKSGGILGAVI